MTETATHPSAGPDLIVATPPGQAQELGALLTAAPAGRIVPRELRRLCMLLPDDVAIVVENTESDAHHSVLREIGASVLRDVPALLTHLRALRAERNTSDRRPQGRRTRRAH